MSFGLLVLSGLLLGCVTHTGESDSVAPADVSGSSASATANVLAQKAVVESIVYENASQLGPPLVVLPGHFKNTNATFSQKFTINNIADFAEIELAKANFKVLERADLGPYLEEVTLAANMGDATGLTRFRKGKFMSTRWFVQFDILKAEPVAEAASGFDGKAIGGIISAVAGDKLGGRIVGNVVSSAGASEEAKVWIVGLRYKIVDASSSAILGTHYIEEKMEVGGATATFLGISQSEKSGATLDSMVQRLVQKCVVQIDKSKGISSAVAVGGGQPSGLGTGATNDPGRQDYGIAKNTDHSASGPAAPFDAKVKKNQYKHINSGAPQTSTMTVQNEYGVASAPDCQELLKTWQLGDSSVMQRYLKECTK